MEVDFKSFIAVFSTVFLAEMGDKTQLATMLFSTRPETSKLMVFVASASALILTSAIAVLAGGLVSQYVDGRLLARIAGVGFIAVGIWTFAAA